MGRSSDARGVDDARFSGNLEKRDAIFAVLGDADMEHAAPMDPMDGQSVAHARLAAEQGRSVRFVVFDQGFDGFHAIHEDGGIGSRLARRSFLETSGATAGCPTEDGTQNEQNEYHKGRRMLESAESPCTCNTGG
ncbi:MAG: hypothetical protein Q9196_006882 [Gyalolechia fulgens]